jgi:hypothetical protein
MKKRHWFIIYVAIFALVFAVAVNVDKDKPRLGVLICNGSNSYAYHITRRCEGLGVCARYADVVSEEDAVKVHKRSPCKFCYCNDTFLDPIPDNDLYQESDPEQDLGLGNEGYDDD